jgi:hypothetical protein
VLDQAVAIEHRMHRAGDSDRTDRLIEMTGSCIRQKSASLSSKRSIMTLYGATGSTCAR